MVPGIYERKWELDSLSNVLHLSSKYYAATQDATPFRSDWLRAMDLAVSTMIDEQQSSAQAGSSPVYQFSRQATAPTDTLQGSRGWPARRTGMIKSAFRGSDDATRLPFNIPENAFAVVALRELAALLEALEGVEGDSESVAAAAAAAAAGGGGGDDDDAADDGADSAAARRRGELAALAAKALALADEVDAGIQKYGIIQSPAPAADAPSRDEDDDDEDVRDENGSIFAYEVDGHGNQHFMDDANVPSLLALPFYGYVNATDALFQRTRAAVLSPKNPWYFEGQAGKGVGGPHVGLGHIWPMALVSAGWTATTDDEVQSLLDQLVASSACTGLMHESFSDSSYADFTRPWFAWMNSYFASFVMKVLEERPHLLLTQNQ